MENFEVKNIDTNISVFTGLIPNAKRMVEIFKQSEKDASSTFLFKDWRSWSRFGSYVWQIGNGLDTTKDFSDNPLFLEEQSIMNEINNAFTTATSNYLKSRGLKKGDDWIVMGPSISKYNHKNVDTPEELKDLGLEMVYHTDYVTLEGHWPGNKFILTCTMYLNDDYEGGNIVFRLPNKTYIDYKPKSGDVLVFPSGHPELLSDEGKYLHGVKAINKQDKYLIRCFYQKPYAGSKEWFDGEEKYGKEKWAKMEKERVDKEQSEFMRLQLEGLKYDS